MKCSVFKTITLFQLNRRFTLFSIYISFKFKLSYTVHFVRVFPLLKEYSNLTLLLR